MCSTVRVLEDVRLGIIGGVVYGERDLEELTPGPLFEV